MRGGRQGHVNMYEVTADPGLGAPGRGSTHLPQQPQGEVLGTLADPCSWTAQVLEGLGHE